MKAVNFLFKNKYLFIIFLLITYVLTALNSVGFYKDDEHFQILEPIAYLLGLNNQLIDDVTGFYWEWQTDHRIRPWFQPFIYFQLISFLKFLNINDPFSWTLIIRLINGLIGFIGITILFFSIKKYFVKDDNIIYYLIYFSFWFFPFLHTRTSSENLSITLLIFAFPFLLNLIISQNKKFSFYKTILFSFVLGLSIVVRPQIIFTIFPIFLWSLLYKFHFYKFILILIGVALAIILGLYIDYLHWGFFSNTYLQIFKIQILNGRMQDFGQEPFWFYFLTIIKDLSPIFGFFFFYLMSIKFSSNIKKIIFSLSLLSNLIFLILIATLPANGKVDLYKYIYSKNLVDPHIYFINDNPYDINDLEPFFYTSFLPNIKKYNNENPNKPFYLITNNYSEHEKISYKENCNLTYTTYPLKLINLVENLKKRKMNWYFYKCNSL